MNANSIPNTIHSNDLWDYLEFIPDMPSRKDRDSLRNAALHNPAEEKRLMIWDYFYRVSENQVGTQLVGEIQICNSLISQAVTEREKQLDDLQNIFLKRQVDLKQKLIRDRKSISIFGFVSLLFLILVALLIFYDFITTEFSLALLIATVFLFVCGITIWFFGIKRQFDRQLRELRTRQLSDEQKLVITYDTLLRQLQKRIKQLDAIRSRLIRQIPTSCSHDQIREWLKEDIQRLEKKAAKTAGVTGSLVRISGVDSEVVTLRAPAELQEDVPQVLTKGDKAKHLSARRYAIFSDGTTEIFYGIYCFEFLMVTEDSLCAHRCFYDFINGKTVGERTTEQFFEDVVGIDVTQEYREVEIGDNTFIQVQDAPTWVLSLSSGHEREITFEGMAYLEAITRRFLLEQVNRAEMRNWVYQSQNKAGNILKALRAKLHEHKKRAI